MLIKYQVFVSSTYEDLKHERDQIIRAVLEMGHIPVGMEMFSAADDEQWQIITRQIDQSDYYVVVLAHRYGSVTDGISYTEKEYDYAVKRGIPVLGFVIDHSAAWPADRLEQDGRKRKALDAFKDKVKKKPVGFWSTADDLHGKFSIALMKLINTNPRPGWARATEIVGPEVMVELSRLSSENAALRKKLDVALHAAKNEVEAERERLIDILDINPIEVSIKYEGSDTWEEPIVSSLLELFEILASEMIIEQSVEAGARYLAFILNEDKGRRVRTVPTNQLKHWFSDLMTLGLVMPSRKKHSVNDKNEYWSLTEEGAEILRILRRRRLERGERLNSGYLGADAEDDSKIVNSASGTLPNS